MKKDIDFHRAEHLTLVMAREEMEGAEPEWSVWILNNSELGVSNVIVNSHGYGERDGQELETSRLRQHFEDVPAGAKLKLEMISPELFSFTNEYWVSYYIGKDIYDKKVVFLPESIIEANMRMIPELGLRGVRHS